MKRVLVVLAIALLAPRHVAAEVMPDQLVRTSIEKINVLLTVNRSVDPGDPRTLYAMLDLCEQVLPHIDFRGMSRFALGRHWREATPVQRARFTHEFRNLLVRIYGTGLNSGSDQQVVYLPFVGKPGGGTAVVKTEVRSLAAGTTIPVHYSFHKVHSVWKLYDITIDGVSLVTTYRNTYADQIRKGGIDSLIAGMARSNNEPPNAKGNAPGTAKALRKSAGQ